MIKRYKRFFFLEVNKKDAKKIRDELFCTLASMTPLMSDSKALLLHNFVRTDQNRTKLYTRLSFFIK